MESPPSTSTWSEPFILSDDSGLLLTCSSFSSGSMSGESRCITDIQDSDCEDKIVSQTDSLDEMSDIMCGENYNTLKKGPHPFSILDCKNNSPIEPPFEFQDKPNIALYETVANNLIPHIINEAIKVYCKTMVHNAELYSNYCVEKPLSAVNTFWTSEFLPFTSPISSHRSLVSSRLSSSHNSLSVPSAHKVDDSSFITQAVSHDTLVSGQISDIYNVPFDSDVYAIPADVIRQTNDQKTNQVAKRKRRNTSYCQELNLKCYPYHQNSKMCADFYRNKNLKNCQIVTKRHSVAGSSANIEGESVHMTLQEIRHYLQKLYSSSSDSSIYKDCEVNGYNDNKKYALSNKSFLPSNKCKNFNQHSVKKLKKTTLLTNIKNYQSKENQAINNDQILSTKSNKSKKSLTRILSFKQTLCNIFNFRKFALPDKKKHAEKHFECLNKEGCNALTNRALPPLPTKRHKEAGYDFTTSIEKVKDYGWYWGPISSEAAEKILSNEPDGSFIVRDSSDDHYIFSLTFKLNNSVRHVRIEHDQGNFSFGSCTKFKSQTIVEFIENAVEHSRSGRYLFFLHRRPIIGPVRVQLLHPVSRFKQVQSLQHMCRFVILKLVRRDLLCNLPLPRRILDYLNTPHYYSEHLCDYEDSDNSNMVSQKTASSQRTHRGNRTLCSTRHNVNVDISDENSSLIFTNNVQQS